MNNIKLLLILAIIYTSFPTNNFSQVDSLKKYLSTSNDSVRIDICNLLSEYEEIENELRLKYAFQALSLSQNTNYALGLAFAYKNIGQVYYDQKIYRTALENYIRSQNEFVKLKSDSLSAVMSQKLGYVYHKLNEHKTAIKNIKEAQIIRSKLNDQKGQASSYANIGYIFWWISQYDSAITNYENAIRIRKVIKDSSEIASNLNAIGTIYYQMADYNKALEYYFKALEASRRKLKYYSPLMLNNVAMVYQKLGNYKLALENYNTSLDIAIKNDKHEAIGYSNYNLGSLKSEISELDSALYFFHRSLKKYKTLSHRGGELLSLSGIGEVHVKLGNYNIAIDTLLTAVSLAQKSKSDLLLATIYNNLGKALLGKRKFIQARNYIGNSLSISVKIKQNYLVGENYKVLSEIENQEGKFESAFKNLSKYKKISDSLFTNKKTQQIVEMQTRFNAKEKERENEQLRFENEIQKIEHNYNNLLLIASLILIIIIAVFYYLRFTRAKKAHDLLVDKNKIIISQNNQLKELNGTKDRLFSIIAHDLKNPFMILQQLTEALSDESGLDELEKAKLIKKIEQKSRSTFEMLDNLLTWAAINIGKISVNLEEENLCQLVNSGIFPYKNRAAKKNISINNNISNDIKLKLDPYLVKTVVGNLVNNSIKFTHEGGNINIDHSQSNDFEKITISDDGVGIDKQMMSQLFRIDEKTNRVGTNSEKGSGLGLILCKDFIEKAGGEIILESKDGKGTSVTFTIPRFK